MYFSEYNIKNTNYKIFLIRLNNRSDLLNEFRKVLIAHSPDYSVGGRVHYSFEGLKIESEIS